jgi:lysylphosphatidylglycerol synthetase-like protein (DUF2156 family)
VRAHAIRVVATLTALVGAAVLICSTMPGWTSRPVTGVAGLVANGRLGLDTAIVVGGCMLVLARGLAGGRRLALYFLLTTLVVGVVALAAGGLLPVASPEHLLVRLVLGTGAVGVLVAARHDFPTLPHPRRVRTAIWYAGFAVGLLVVHAGWYVAVAREHGTWATKMIGAALGLATAGCVVLALATALAPAPAPEPDPPHRRALAAALVAHPDSESLAPFITRADKSYAFSPDDRAAIGYRVVFGVALAGGDPVGARHSADGAIAAFLDTCTRNGWRPAAIGAGTPMVELWRARGVRRRVPIGDEAVIDVAAFALTSRRMRNVRQAVNRTRNAGVSVEIGAADAGRLAPLEPIRDDWLAGRQERGFSMNLDRLLAPRAGCVVAVARDRDGRPQGFARFASCAGGRALTLDVAPRRNGAPNGIVERIIVDVVEYGRARGAEEVSLNFAGFRRLYAATGPFSGAVTGVLHLFDRWIELGPLYRFTAKFHPTWRARSVVLPSWLALAQVGVAAMWAELGRPVPVDGEVPDWSPVVLPPDGAADEQRARS